MPLDTIVLLGWMERDDAVAFLRNECVFPDPLSEPQALELWQTYHQRIDELPPRPIHLPKMRQMTADEKNWERQFLQFCRNNGAKVKSVIKVNLLELVAHQLHVVTARAADYAQQLANNKRTWNERCLPIKGETFTFNTEIRSFGLKMEADINVPHAEWLLTPIQQPNGELFFRPAPALKYVTATVPEPDRMLLWSGYHRSYAWVANNRGDGIDCPALVALAENVVAPPIAGNLSVFDRLVRGPRPPLFCDFFDERLFMRIPIKRKKYQMQIRSEIVSIEER